MNNSRFRTITSGLLCAVLMVCCTASAARIRRVGPGGTVTLPYVQADGAGNQWAVYPGGWIRQNGPQPLYGQGETLLINGNNPGMNNNMAKLDPQTGELVLEGLNAGNCMVTRRILLGGDSGLVRYIEIIKNIQAQDQTFNVQIQSNLNYGVSGSVLVNDPKHKDSQIGWVALTGINRAALEMFAGKGAKLSPTINYEPGNSMVQANYAVEVPAGKSVALVHLMGAAASIDQGQQTILSVKEAKVLASVPADIRKIIANFATGDTFINDLEILRGDVFDVIELRSGDLIKGTLKEDSYKLATFYGAVELPKGQVIALMNIGQYRPRQLIVTVDGQVFGGNLQNQSIAMELSSGQVVQVPLSQMSRVGCRKQPGEPQEWTFDKPCVVMRSGDRVNVEMPAGPIEVLTRYGLLRLDPRSIASIVFQGEDNGVHEIYLTDGSKFAGLVTAPAFDMKLLSGFAAQPVRFPTSSLLALRLAGKAAEADDTTPSMALINQDLLVATLEGTLNLDTAFDTVQISGVQVRRLTHAAGGSADVQVTLWDNTIISGQLQQQEVQCKLLSGTSINIPLALVSEYNQPLPRPSDVMIEKIKTLVTGLSADDWKQRDEAEAALVTLGPSVISVLKDQRSSQPPEAQERIDAIIKRLGESSATPAKAASGVTVQPMPEVQQR
ncbi:MAG: hypothetical protein ABR964_01080 [Tepidisphaeraceae bacterium]